MAVLTDQARQALPLSKFAVPATRRFPINDKTHAEAAKRLLPKANNLSDDEKKRVIQMANAMLSGKTLSGKTLSGKTK